MKEKWLEQLAKGVPLAQIQEEYMQRKGPDLSEEEMLASHAFDLKHYYSCSPEALQSELVSEYLRMTDLMRSRTFPDTTSGSCLWRFTAVKNAIIDRRLQDSLIPDLRRLVEN